MVLTFASLAVMAQDGGVKGRVVSRDGRAALSGVKVAIESMGLTATTDSEGNFLFEGLPAGDYKLSFEAPEFEDSDIVVRVDRMVKDTGVVSMVPDVQAVIDDSLFSEFDSDAESAGDSQALPSSLSSSKPIIAAPASDAIFALLILG